MPKRTYTTRISFKRDNRIMRVNLRDFAILGASARVIGHQGKIVITITLRSIRSNVELTQKLWQSLVSFSSNNTMRTIYFESAHIFTSFICLSLFSETWKSEVYSYIRNHFSMLKFELIYFYCLPSLCFILYCYTSI